MLIYQYVILTLLLPFPALWNLIKQKNRFNYNWWAAFLLFVLLLLFIFQAGAWPYLGFNWRYLIPVIYVLIFVILFWRKYKNISAQPKPSSRRGLIVSAIFILLFAYTNVEIYRGGSTQEDAIELAFPLRNGSYTIMQGGDSEIGNAVHRYNTPHSYAIDIVKLNENKKRGNQLFSKNVNDYTIYGDTIFSPCDGTIITYYDGVEENIPPTTNLKKRGGNHVVIRTGDIKILICHMQKNSIAVKRGDTVKTGDVIGLVGNTGFSIEPHLHIQAYKTERSVNMMVPIRFDGRFLNMNDIITSEPE